MGNLSKLPFLVMYDLGHMEYRDEFPRANIAYCREVNTKRVVYKRFSTRLIGTR